MSKRTLMLLTHTPREGSVENGYHEWIREIDTPFFNSVPGILHYSVWKTEHKHPSINFSHFDLLEYEGPSDNIWAYEALDQFAAGWTKKWSQHPESSNPADNFSAYDCTHISGVAASLGGCVKLSFDSSAQADAENWKITDGIIGKPPWSTFSLEALTPSTNLCLDKQEVALIANLIGAPRIILGD